MKLKTTSTEKQSKVAPKNKKTKPVVPEEQVIEEQTQKDGEDKVKVRFMINNDRTVFE